MRSAPGPAKTFGSIPASAASSWPSAVTRTTGSSSTGLATCEARRGLERWPEGLGVERHAAADGVAAGQDRGDARSVPARADSATVPSATTAASAIIIAPR